MTMSMPITRHLGTAERTLQALLQTQLRKVGLSFPEWVVLTILHSSGSLPLANVIDALERGQIGDRDGVDALVARMAERGLIAPAEFGMSITPLGAELYLPLRHDVDSLTAEIVAGIPADDLDATRRTLDEVTRRASRLLSTEGH